MAKALQRRRGTHEEHKDFVGLEGEFTYDTTEKRIVAHDGATAGGVPVAKESEVVKTVNGVAPTNGNVAVSSVASATKATQDGSGNVITSTYATIATVASVSTTATNAQTTATNAATAASNADTKAGQRVLMSGARGTLAGYNTPASSSSAITIDGSSSDDTVVTSAVAVTIANGSSGQTWAKTVALQNASATVTLGSSWAWVGGSAPTIKANSILIVKWCGSFGLANLVNGG